MRGYNRALHRDLGNLAVGLTVIYALSGLAVNHIADWDPSFVSYQRTVELGGPVKAGEGGDEAAARAIAATLKIDAKVRDTYRPKPSELEISFDKRTLHVDTDTGRVLDEGQEPRFFLRVANWLHLNRGKKSWTYFADFYAVALLVLSASGLFMLPGRKGLIGRGGIFVLVGAAVPVAYLVLSGGPERAGGHRDPPPAMSR